MWCGIFISVNFPSKHFLISKTSWGRLKDIFNVTIFHLPRRLQDVFKTSSRRFQEVFARILPNMFSRCLQNIFKTSLQDVFKIFSRRFLDVFLKIFSKRLQDILQTRLEYVLKTSWRRLGRQKFVELKTSSRCLQGVFNTSSPRPMFAGFILANDKKSELKNIWQNCFLLVALYILTTVIRLTEVQILVY